MELLGNPTGSDILVRLSESKYAHIHCMYNILLIKSFPYVMFMSTLTPGAARGPVINASVDTQSTSVAVIPPCKPPVLLVSSSPTFI